MVLTYSYLFILDNLKEAKKVCAPTAEYNPFSNTCFEVSNMTKNWEDAQNYCMTQGGHLATLESLDSLYWFMNEIRTNSGCCFVLFEQKYIHLLLRTCFMFSTNCSLFQLL